MHIQNVPRQNVLSDTRPRDKTSQGSRDTGPRDKTSQRQNIAMDKTSKVDVLSFRCFVLGYFVPWDVLLGHYVLGRFVPCDVLSWDVLTVHCQKTAETV